MIGNPTGFHKLDLSFESDYQAAKKLAEFNNAERRASRATSGRGDTSFKGNWENFRSERFNDKRTTLNARFFINLIPSGTLKFDYISTTRPKAEMHPMSVRRFFSLCATIQLETFHNLTQAYQRMNQQMRSRSTLFSRGGNKFTLRGVFEDASSDSSLSDDEDRATAQDENSEDDSDTGGGTGAMALLSDRENSSIQRNPLSMLGFQVLQVAPTSTCLFALHNTGITLDPPHARSRHALRSAKLSWHGGF